MVSVKYRSVSELGLKDVHIACLKGDLEDLSKLLLEKKNIELRTSLNETPLILSTLLGNVEAVILLRQHHAIVESVDRYGRNALAYTSDNVFTDTRRTAYVHCGFVEAEGAALRRIAIAAYLSTDPHPRLPRNYTGIASGPIYFRKTSDGMEAYQSIGYVKTPGIDPRLKTVGFIRTLSDITPRAWAISGWSEVGFPESSRLINGSKWTKAALRRVAPAIGFVFQPHLNDQGWRAGTISAKKRGRFFASHTEVKLAVWYCFSLLTAVNSLDNLSMTYLSKHLVDLARAELGEARQARIEIDQDSCESCARFLGALTKITNIDFEPKYRRTLALVPEVEKRRRFLLAHQANLVVNSQEDTGSDTDGDSDDEDNDQMSDFGHWSSGEEAETILGGVEEHTTKQYHPRSGTSNEKQRSQIKFRDALQGNNTKDEGIEEDDLESVESYRDEAADNSYHGRSTNNPCSRSSIYVQPNELPDPFVDNSYDFVESNILANPAASLETPISSPYGSPGIPSLQSTLSTHIGSVENPIWIPNSPSRKTRKGPEERWSPYYLEKTRGYRSICLPTRSNDIKKGSRATQPIAQTPLAKKSLAAYKMAPCFERGDTVGGLQPITQRPSSPADCATTKTLASDVPRKAIRVFAYGTSSARPVTPKKAPHPEQESSFLNPAIATANDCSPTVIRHWRRLPPITDFREEGDG